MRLGQQHGPFPCEASGSQSGVLLVCHGGSCEGQMLGRDQEGAWAWNHGTLRTRGPVFLWLRAHILSTCPLQAPDPTGYPPSVLQARQPPASHQVCEDQTHLPEV